MQSIAVARAAAPPARCRRSRCWKWWGWIATAPSARGPRAGTSRNRRRRSRSTPHPGAFPNREKATACSRGSAPRPMAATWRGPMRVLDAGPRRLVGVFRATGSGGGVIEPAERRSRRDVAVPAGKTAGARSGELVVGEIEPGSRLGLTDAQGGRAAGRRGLAGRDQPRRDPRPRPADALPRRGAGGGRACDGAGPRRSRRPAGAAPGHHRRRRRPRLRRRGLGGS